MNRIEFFKKLFNNEDPDMYDAILNLLENIADTYNKRHSEDKIRMSYWGIETYYEVPIYSMGCWMENKTRTEIIKWEDILDEFWLQETGEWYDHDAKQKAT